MVPLKTVFLIFINLNILGLIALIYYSGSVPDDRLLLEPDGLIRTDSLYMNKAVRPSELHKIYAESEESAQQYTFEDPKMANFVLNQLEVGYFMGKTNFSNFAKPFLGLKHDTDYCKKKRTYFSQNPEETFQDFKALMDFPASHLVRKTVLPSIGTDIQKYVTVAQTKERKSSFVHNITAKANGFFINDMVHNYQQIGKSYACLTQTYNHIPGHSVLNRKDKSAEALVQYSKMYEERSHCFNSTKFFPKTWVLYIEDQCKNFFDHLNSQAYQDLKKERTIVYIRKQGSGAHMAKGVQPMDDEEEQSIRDIWSNGTGCGEVKKNYIVQDFVHNPQLLNGHKFDFRIYMLIASSNPVIAYYHDGFLRVSIHKYDINSKDKSVLLTNTHLAEAHFKNASKGELINGMNETELRNFQMWNLERLHSYLMEQNIVHDNNWLNNYLRPEFKKAMIHLIRMSQEPFFKMSSLYEIFGVDFMLDENMSLWFLECNSSPVMEGTSVEKTKLMTDMLSNHFEIVIGLLRSRTKRIINYVNEVVRDIKSYKAKTGQYELRNLNKKKEVYAELVKNNFEPEFEPKSTNTWYPIINENYNGAARYMNLIPEECL